MPNYFVPPGIPFPRQQVTRVVQSPMNPLRWALELDCGHDEWVTQKSRPTRNTAKCSTCQRQAQ